MNQEIVCIRITIKGIVQGVGFRPHVYRLADECHLKGWVLNSSRGVYIEVEGRPEQVEEFTRRVVSEPPPLALIKSCQLEVIEPQGFSAFNIRESQPDDFREVMISPDIAICGDCQREVLDDADRRFRYPFINCTNCGPRFTIIRDVPYDRAKTTMAPFPMCRACNAEYHNPLDRRFHAQPNACPVCGPTVALLDAAGKAVGDEVVNVLKQGAIVAVKGLGAFHLAADASNRSAVKELRLRKRRDAKPFALMARDLETVKKYCLVSEQEEAWLLSPQAPIVVMKTKTVDGFPGDLIHPGLNTLGVMLPYSPLHYLLFDESLPLLVMTSANISDEPLIIENHEALDSLHGIADFFFIHNREIFNPCDDSVLQVTGLDSSNFIRRARGFVPRGISIPSAYGKTSVLAVGGEMKSTFCLTRQGEAYLSQHWGDLTNYHNYANYLEGIERFKLMLAVEPGLIAHDLHPDYQSTRWAKRQNLPTVAIQHHYAHMTSVMAENGLTGPCIGMICDGTGWGTDGAIWGCELLAGDYQGFQRLGHLEYQPMPGGDVTIKKPYRMAFIYLYQVMGEKAFDYAKKLLPELTREEMDILVNRMHRPSDIQTSSCGRLFDAISAILGIAPINRYEGEAAMALEASAARGETGFYPARIRDNGQHWIMEVRDLWPAILTDMDRVSHAVIATRFHNTLIRLFTGIILKARDKTGLNRAVLSGGVFHNDRLLTGLVQALRTENMDVYYHQQVPSGDGGIALGQAVIASEVN